MKKRTTQARYQLAEASIHVREHEGELQSVAIQKTYLRETSPIWKMHSPYQAIPETINEKVVTVICDDCFFQ